MNLLRRLTFALALAMGGLGFAVAQDGEGPETTSGAAEEAGLDATQRANLARRALELSFPVAASPLRIRQPRG